MFCGECGTQNPDTNQFCKNCGKPLGRRQPAAEPAARPTPVPEIPPVAQPVPAPIAPSPPPVTAAAPSPAAVPKRQWNWLGIISLIPGILSWILFTGILAISAILLGIAGIVIFRKATGRIGISSLIGIALGIVAIAVKTMLP